MKKLSVSQSRLEHSRLSVVDTDSFVSRVVLVVEAGVVERGELGPRTKFYSKMYCVILRYEYEYYSYTIHLDLSRSLSEFMFENTVAMKLESHSMLIIINLVKQ